MSEKKKRGWFARWGMKKDPAPETTLEPEVTEEAPAEEAPDEATTNVEPAEVEAQPENATPELVPVEAEVSEEPPVPAPVEQAPEPQEEKLGFFGRLKKGLSRSSSKISEGIGDIFNKARLDDDTLQELEDLLITTDIGVETVMDITAKLAKDKFDKDVSPEEIREFVAGEIAARMEPLAVPFGVDEAKKPYVVMMVGVNGTGKTTTIGKLAHILRGQGRSVMLCAGDTFRAAAIEQLKIWGERTNTPVISGATGSDSAGLAFDALKEAKEAGSDVLLIDTAGRLQNKKDLMQELAKVIRVLKKQDESAPHSVLLVLDGTTGQNALGQVTAFKEMADVTGLIMTKLDGTARGGILVAVAAKHQLPIHAIGVGETLEDFQPFDANAYARALIGLEEDGEM